MLGSLAKGQDDHVYSILSSGAIETLIRGMCLIFAYILGLKPIFLRMAEKYNSF